MTKLKLQVFRWKDRASLNTTLEVVLKVALSVSAATDKSLLASRTKVWNTTQRTEDIANVVVGLNTSSKSSVPPVQNTLHDLDTSNIEVLNSRLECALLRGLEQIVGRRCTGVGPFEVRRSAHHDDAGEIGQLVDRGSEQDLEGGVILLCGCAIVARSISQHLGGVFKHGAEDIAAVVHVGGGDIALNNTRGQGGSLVFPTGSLVAGAVGLGSGRVRQVCLAREIGGNCAKVGVQLEDLCPVDAGRVLAWEFGALRNISGGKVAGKLAEIDFILQSDLDRVPSKGRGCSGGFHRVDASNARDKEVGLGEIEQRGESNGGDSSSSIDLAFSGDELANIVVLGAVDVRE
jgi:hypothetical protein